MIASALSVLGFASIAFADQETAQKKSLDPNEKICVTIIPLGSRIGGRRVCATRAEWAEKRRLDRAAIDQGQRNPCMPQTSGTTGKPSC
jgi:hypothetical protein